MGCLLCPGRPWLLALPKQSIRGQMRNGEKALLGPLLQQEERARGAGPQEGASWFLPWGARATGWLGWFACPFGGAATQGHTQYPALAALQKWQLGFLVSLYLLCIICHTAPACSYF